MSAEIDRLRHALASMYTCADAAERNSADKFLQEFLYSQECWDLSIALLKLPTATSYEHLFCARALHVRLRCSVSKAERKQKSHEVMTADRWEEARNVLIALAARWSHEPSGRTILTQICSAVAVLVCKMESWETKMVVKDLALSFAAANMAMLETIRVLPEEVSSRHLSIHPQRRQDVSNCLKQSFSQIAEYLTLMWRESRSIDDASVGLCVIQALNAWLEHGCGSFQFQHSEILREAPVLLISRASTTAPHVHHSCCFHHDFISEAISLLCSYVSHVCSDHNDGPYKEENRQFCLHLLQLMLPPPAVHGISSSHSLFEVRSSIITILVHSAATFLSLKNEESFAISAELMKALAEDMERNLPDWMIFPQEEDATQTFSQSLSSWSSAREVSEASVPLVRSALLLSLREVGCSTISVISSKIAFPVDCWSEEMERDGAETYGGACEADLVRHPHLRLREDLADALRDIAVIIGSDLAISTCLQVLHARCLSSPRACPWEEAEGIVQSLHAICRGASHEAANECVRGVSLLLHRTQELHAAVHPRLLETCSWLMGLLCSSLQEEAVGWPSLLHIVYQTMRSPRYPTVRGGCVAFMKVAQSSGPMVLRSGQANEAFLMYKHKQLASPSPTELRVGQEPSLVVLLRGLVAVIRWQEDPHAQEESIAELLHPLLHDLGESISNVRAVLQQISSRQGGNLLVAEPLAALAWSMRACAIVCDHFPMVLGRRKEIEEAVMGKMKEALEATMAVREEETRFGVSQAAAEVMKSIVKQGRAGSIADSLTLLEHAFLLAIERGQGGTFLLLLRDFLPSLREQAAPSAARLCDRVLVDLEGEKRQAVEEHTIDAFLSLLCSCAECRLPEFVSPPALARTVQCCLSFLRGSSGSTARLALQLASQLIIAALGDKEKNLPPIGQEVFIAGGALHAIVKAMLEAANGQMPPSHVIDVAASLHAACVRTDMDGVRVIIESAAQEHKNPTETQLKTFVGELLSDVCLRDVRRFKRVLKAFCGGKKKGM